MSLGEDSLQGEREEEEEEEAVEDLQMAPHPAGQCSSSLCSHTDAHLFIDLIRLCGRLDPSTTLTLCPND